MATGSTVYAVKAALVALLEANGALAGVLVSHGYPGEGNVQAEMIYVDRATGGHRIPVFRAGRKTREETYTVVVCVFVAKDDTTVAAVEQRAFALLQEVEDALADDPTLGGVDGLVHAVAGEFREQADQGQTGPGCLIEFDVNVLARIT